MSNVNGVNGTSGVSYGMDAGLTYMSPDTLLAYCQLQLGSVDGEINSQMKAQELQLTDRKAVEGVQSTLESFGTQGPQNGYDMQTCVEAFQTAINQLAPGDPTRGQLASQLNQMTYQYGYVAEEEPGLEKAPANDQWKGTVDAVGTLAGDIKSGAEIQMLQLQDLVSQRQQAVQLASGMMSKEDQTLEGQAKAIGQ